MFSKKTAIPTTAVPAAGQTGGFPVQCLTSDFVAGGWLPPMETPILGFVNQTSSVSLTLTRCKVSSLNVQAVIPGDLPEVILPKTGVAVIVPRDEAGLRSATLNLPGASRRAILHTGPYVVAAAVRLISEAAFANFLSAGGGLYFVVTDATVRCVLPAARFQEIKSSALLLNRNLVQLYYAS